MGVDKFHLWRDRSTSLAKGPLSWSLACLGYRYLFSRDKRTAPFSEGHAAFQRLSLLLAWLLKNYTWLPTRLYRRIVDCTLLMSPYNVLRDPYPWANFSRPNKRDRQYMNGRTFLTLPSFPRSLDLCESRNNNNVTCFSSQRCLFLILILNVEFAD